MTWQFHFIAVFFFSLLRTPLSSSFFFLNDPAPPEIYTFPLHDALPISSLRQPGAILLVSCYELGHQPIGLALPVGFLEQAGYAPASLDIAVEKVDLERITQARLDRKSTRLNSSHLVISYAVFCLKKKNT